VKILTATAKKFWSFYTRAMLFRILILATKCGRQSISKTTAIALILKTKRPAVLRQDDHIIR